MDRYVRIFLILLFGLVLLVGSVYDISSVLSLEELQKRRVLFSDFVEQDPFSATLVYASVYIGVTASSLPGAAVMTLAGGWMFGVVKGTLIVSFCSTIGACMAFLAARTVLRRFLLDYFGDKAESFDKDLAREGVWFLLVLRLVPLVPFFLVNLLMGLTSITLWRFWWVSQIGMLPGTLLYVNAGTQLAGVRSLGDILSIRVLIPLVLLGMVPLLLRLVIGRSPAALAKQGD